MTGSHRKTNFDDPVEYLTDPRQMDFWPDRHRSPHDQPEKKPELMRQVKVVIIKIKL